MGGVAKAVTKVVSKAVDTVGDAVDDVGDAVVDKVLKPVVKTVDNTIKAAAEDPLGTAVKVAAISTGNPAIMAAANAAVAVANGADLESAALAAGKGYIAGEIAQGVSAELQPEFASSGDLTASQAAAAAKVAGNVAATTAVGGDPLQALVNGGISAGTAAVTAEIPGFDSMTKAQQAAVNSAVAKTLKGGDASQTLINEAIVAGVSAAQNYASAPSSDLVSNVIPESKTDYSIGVTDTQTTTPDQSFKADYSLTSGMDMGGTGLQGSVGPLDSTDLYSFNPTDTGGEGLNYDFASSVGNLPDMGGGQGLTATNTATGDVVGEADSSLDSLLTNNITGKPLGEDLGNITTGAEDYLNDLPDESESSTDLGKLARDLLNLVPKAAYGTGIAMGANALLGGDSKDGYGSLTYFDPNQSVAWNPQEGTVKDGVAYGLDQLGGTYTTNAAQGGIMSLAQGGQTSSLGGYAAGGNPRLLRGPGDGMSDNIPASIAGKQPARLADGEFVVPADVVSHLGNGSTEAGAKVLYQMMERVRKARTGNPNQGRQIKAQNFVPRKGK